VIHYPRSFAFITLSRETGRGDLFEIRTTGKAIFDQWIKSQTFALSLTAACANIPTDG
jgi:hypothetical protein